MWLQPPWGGGGGVGVGGGGVGWGRGLVALPPIAIGGCAALQGRF